MIALPAPPARKSKRPPWFVFALIALVLVVGTPFALAHHQTCQRLGAARLSYLMPGQTTPGPFNLNVRDAGSPGSQVSQYRAADEAWHSAGC